MSRSVGDSLVFNAARKPGETQIVNLVDLFNSNPNQSICVCGTVDEDGTPHTAPVSLIIAKDDRTLLVGFLGENTTTKNIRRFGWASLEVLGPNDLSVGIKGRVEIVKEPMDCNATMVVGKMIVEAVKQDTSPAQVVVTGASSRPRSERGQAFAESVIEELKKMAGR